MTLYVVRRTAGLAQLCGGPVRQAFTLTYARPTGMCTCSPPHAGLAQASGGRDFVYAKQLDRARRNLKPTTRPISKCPHSRLNPFSVACNAIALQPNLQSEPRSCGPNRTASLAFTNPACRTRTPPGVALAGATRAFTSTLRCGRTSWTTCSTSTALTSKKHIGQR